MARGRVNIGGSSNKPISVIDSNMGSRSMLVFSEYEHFNTNDTRKLDDDFFMIIDYTTVTSMCFLRILTFSGEPVTTLSFSLNYNEDPQLSNVTKTKSGDYLFAYLNYIMLLKKDFSSVTKHVTLSSSYLSQRIITTSTSGNYILLVDSDGVVSRLNPTTYTLIDSLKSSLAGSISGYTGDRRRIENNKYAIWKGGGSGGVYLFLRRDSDALTTDTAWSTSTTDYSDFITLASDGLMYTSDGSDIKSYELPSTRESSLTAIKKLVATADYGLFYDDIQKKIVCINYSYSFYYDYINNKAEKNFEIGTQAKGKKFYGSISRKNFSFPLSNYVLGMYAITKK